MTAASVREAAQKKTLLYDKSGEEHYNLISALHKSLRDSDPDAALYWLTRMLEAGEDRLYLARRLVRFASEDVGNADPQALLLTLAAKEAYDFLGDPEGELALAQATLYLALAPNSNAVYVTATDMDEGDIVHFLRRTLDLLRQIGTAPHVPEHLRELARAAFAVIDREPVNEVF